MNLEISDTAVRQREHESYNRSLDEDGFLVWPRLIPEPLIDAHLSALENLMRNLTVDKGRGTEQMTREELSVIKRSRASFHREHQPTLELIFNRELMDFLRYRFGDEPVMRQPQTGLYQQHAPIHTESLDIKPDSFGGEVRIWCALENVNPDAGPVYYVPRSHNLISSCLEERLSKDHPDFIDVLERLTEPTTHAAYGAATGPFFKIVKEEILPQLVEQMGLQRVAPILAKGDAVIFRTDVVHGTSPCVNPSLTRKYLTAFWTRTSTRWYHTRSWWGPKWDFRSAENSIVAPIEQFALGSRIEFKDYYEAYLTSFGRRILMPQRSVE
jgi:hypothetical protein